MNDNIPLGEPIIKSEVLYVAMTDSEKFSFIRNTYTCLLLQLFFTFSLLIISKFYNLNEFYVSDTGLGLAGISLSMMLVNIFVLCLCQNLYREAPYNIVLISLFTFSLGYLLSYYTAIVPQEYLLIASGVTAIDVCVLTAVSFWWTINTNFLQQFLIISFLTLFCMILVNTFLQTHLMTLVIAYTGSSVFSGFLLYDTYTIINDTTNYSKHDFILAAMNLYLDIVNIFYYFVSCLMLRYNE